MNLLGTILGNPRYAGAVSIFSLLDAANCVRLGHADWIIPASVALVFAFAVRPAGET